jgi:hypothetical protein
LLSGSIEQIIAADRSTKTASANGDAVSLVILGGEQPRTRGAQ